MYTPKLRQQSTLDADVKSLERELHELFSRAQSAESLLEQRTTAAEQHVETKAK